MHPNSFHLQVPTYHLPFPASRPHKEINQTKQASKKTKAKNQKQTNKNTRKSFCFTLFSASPKPLLHSSWQQWSFQCAILYTSLLHQFYYQMSIAMSHLSILRPLDYVTATSLDPHQNCSEYSVAGHESSGILP